jgi:selenocysteine lyase/cysteine desulfurase
LEADQEAVLAHAPSERAGDALPLSGLHFDVSGIYLNSAARHPLPRNVVRHLEAYASFLGHLASPQELSGKRDRVRSLFARLIGADENEIALVPSTTYAENLVLSALGLPSEGGPIITDELHFSGSLAIYRNLMDAGCDVTILPAVDGRIPLADMEKALRRGVRLVAISATSHRNGHEYDLEALCALAHRHGSYVYADIVQTAGVTPFDVRSSAVDFAGCGAYKWLMGDMGLGFLYVRGDLIPRLRRPVGGGEQFLEDRSGSSRRPGASGTFEVGTIAASALEALLVSLPSLLSSDMDACQSLRRPLLERLRTELGALGFPSWTPQGSKSPILAFSSPAITGDLLSTLSANGVHITGKPGSMRMSISCFNTSPEIEQTVSIVRRASHD